jgi:hypothetical protein
MRLFASSRKCAPSALHQTVEPLHRGRHAVIDLLADLFELLPHENVAHLRGNEVRVLVKDEVVD